MHPYPYLIKLAKSTENPNILKKILKKNKKDVISWFAARNPNCPFEDKIKWMEDKIKWMRKCGYIETEDPNNPNHIIEYEKKNNRKNKTIEAFKAML